MKAAICLLALAAPAAVVAEDAAAPAYLQELHYGGGHLPHPPRSLAEARSFHQRGQVNAIRRARAHGHTLDTFTTPSFVAARRRAVTDELASAATRVSPVDFGADPTGVADSTAAMQKAMQAVVANCNASAPLGHKIHDCRGATLDLGGGVYSMTAGLKVPVFLGNIKVTTGTLLAAPGFASDDFLMTIGADSCVPPDNQKVCNEDISIVNVLFEAAHRGGCLRVFKTMGTVVFDSYFSRFTTHGIWETGGHELMVQESWVTAYYWHEPAPTSTCGTAAGNRNEVGIQIDSNDNYLVNVIGFADICTGVQINGAANVLNGVHTWVGHVGIQMGGAGSSYGASQNRLTNCYLDYASFDVYEPQNLVMDQTFWLVAKLKLYGKKVNGFAVRDSIWGLQSGPDLTGYTGTADTTKNVVLSATNTDVSFDTSLKSSLTGPSDRPFKFDFSHLVFPWIRHVQYSVAGAAGTEAFTSFVEVEGTVATVHVQGGKKQTLTVHIAVEN